MTLTPNNTPANNVALKACPLNDLVVKLTEFAIMDLDANEENSMQIETWGSHAEQAIRDFLAARTPSPASMDEQVAAWTATSGYRYYPAFMNLTGNRLSVRGPEQAGDDGHPKCGEQVAIDLPDAALAGIRAAITAMHSKGG